MLHGMNTFQAHYQQELSLKRYYSTLETHTEGRAYKNFITYRFPMVYSPQ